MSTPNFEEEKIQRDIRNLQDDFENFQYIVTKKIGPGSAKIPTSSVPGARQYDAVVDVNRQGDFVTIQEALDAGRKRIFVRAGTYTISAQINITSSNVSIVGEDRATTILKFPNSPGSNYLIMQIGDNVSTFSNITVQNIQFDGNRSNQTTATDVLKSYKINNLYILNCDFVNAHSIAVELWFTTLANVQNCYFNDNRFESLEIHNSSSYCWVLNNYFNATDGIASSIALFLAGDYCVVANNFIANSETNVDIGGQYNKFYSNRIESASSINIYLANNNNIVSQNILYDSEIDNLYIDGDRNIITANNVQKSGQGANNTYSSIFLTGTSSYNSISHNNIYETDTNKSKYGIAEEDSGQNYNVITNNIVQGAVTANISTQGANTIEANNIA